ncbi:hypothetical protein CW304_15320 [Bacillus sp. UFRGS-B20]|nr:hypothetical protein CW304_15320 [Bacillus sp. UFRGS-B20]
MIEFNSQDYTVNRCTRWITDVETATAKGCNNLLFASAENVALILSVHALLFQGFVNAGSFLAKFMHDAGAKVIQSQDCYGRTLIKRI